MIPILILCFFSKKIKTAKTNARRHCCYLVSTPGIALEMTPVSPRWSNDTDSPTMENSHGRREFRAVLIAAWVKWRAARLLPVWKFLEILLKFSVSRVPTSAHVSQLREAFSNTPALNSLENTPTSRMVCTKSPFNWYYCFLFILKAACHKEILMKLTLISVKEQPKAKSVKAKFHSGWTAGLPGLTSKWKDDVKKPKTTHQWCWTRVQTLHFQILSTE